MVGPHTHSQHRIAAGQPAAPTSRAECLVQYEAAIAAAQASGDYSHYADLAAQYNTCLTGSEADPAAADSHNSPVSAGQSTVVPMTRAQCLSQYQQAIADAQARGVRSSVWGISHISARIYMSWYSAPNVAALTGNDVACRITAIMLSLQRITLHV